MNKTALVVPCYDEARRLDQEAFSAAVVEKKNLHILFVNDGSRDETSKILRDLCARYPAQLSLLDLKTNTGKAEAVRRGVLLASKNNHTYIGYWDADLATPLSAVAAFEKTLDDNPHINLVMGARVKLLGRRIDRRGIRHYAGRVFATFASAAIGLAVYDTQCGAKLFRWTENVEAIFSRPFHVNWTFDVEILARLKMLHQLNGGPSVEDSTIEYPLEQWVDVAGSKVRVIDFVIGAWEITKIFGILHAPGFENRAKELTRSRKSDLGR